MQNVSSKWLFEKPVEGDLNFFVLSMIQSLPKNFGNKLNLPLQMNTFVDLPRDYLDLISMTDK